MITEKLLQRLRGLVLRNYRAWELGIPLGRSRDFKAPREVFINGKKRPIQIPEELGSAVAFADIFLTDSYGLRRAKRPIGTVLDIGAHAGLFSLFSRMLYPDATIHSYEPNPAMHPYIEYQAREAPFQMYPEAVGETAGTISIVTGAESVNASVASGGNIPMIPFSQAVERLGGSVDFLKLDCEGSEWSILRDAASFRKVREVSMEYHLCDGHTVDELIGVFTRLGFRVLAAERNALGYGLLRAVRLES